jgi:hypothetical protein
MRLNEEMLNCMFPPDFGTPAHGLPSLRVIVPAEFKSLINPRRLDFAQLAIGAPQNFPFDPRF